MELRLGSDKSEYILGRQEGSDVVIANEAVSRKHARIYKDGNDWLIEDLGSRHGTSVNGEPLAKDEKKLLRHGDLAQIGPEKIRILTEAEPVTTSQSTYFIYQNGPMAGQKVQLDSSKPELIIGRGPEANWQIDDKNISRKHAKIKQDIDGIWIEDLSSKNGTWLNGQQLSAAAQLKDADVIGLGDLKLTFVDANAALLNRLSTVPAFQEEEPVKTPAPEPNNPTTPPTKIPESSHWIDYAYMILMGIVLIGLVVGAILWARV
jgi:pSer/pThr/pTyr-binding forkhead associated (FHA) protein